MQAFLIQIAGVFVIIGHTFPIFFGFKGGKGVATSLGVLLITNWRIGLICLVFALVIILLTKMVSLGSIGAAVLFPILLFFNQSHYLAGDSTTTISYLIFGIIVAALVIFNHRENIQRLATGKESKISFKK